MVRPLRHNRDFTLLWSGTAFSFLGSQVCSFALPLAVLWSTHSPGAAGWVAFAANLPNLLVQIPAGLAVDRWDRKWLLIWCDVGRAVAAVGLCCALLFGWMWLPGLMIGIFIYGTLSVLHQVAERSAVRNVVAKEHLRTAASQNEARERAAGMLGKPIGGVLANVAQWVPFISAAASHVVSLTTLIFIRGKLQAEPSGERRRPVVELREAAAWLRKNHSLKIVFAIVAAGNVLFQMHYLSVMVVLQEIGSTQAATGFVLAAAGVGGLLGALCASWLANRFSLTTMLVVSNFLWFAVISSTAAMKVTLLIGLGYALVGFVGGALSVAVVAYQMTVTPLSMQGKVTSLALLIVFGAVPIGSLVGGQLLDWLGGRISILVIGGLMLSVALWSVVASPRIRSFESKEGVLDEV